MDSLITRTSEGWEVPDAKEFVRKTGWVDGKFVVCGVIEGVVVYEELAMAEAEARMLLGIIRAAQEIERDLRYV